MGFIYFFKFLFIDFRETKEGKEREKTHRFVFPLMYVFMVDSCMCLPGGREGMEPTTVLYQEML